MRALTIFVVILSAGFLFSGCQDMNQDITSANTDKVPVPYKGSFEGTAVYLNTNIYPFPIELTASGNATHIGKFTAIYYYDLTFDNFPPPPPPQGGTFINGYGNKIAANGDEIHATTLQGTWWFTSATEIQFTISGVIDGGTGRFINATGSFNGTGTQIFSVPFAAQPTTCSWSGFILY